MTRTNKDLLNEANPNKINTGFQMVGVGNALNLVPKFYKGLIDATTHIMTLPNSAKCAYLIGGVSTVGTTKGQLAPQKPGAAVGTTLFAAPTANGDILFNTADACTEAEVVYLAFDGELKEAADLAVLASGVVQLPNSERALMLISATQVGGTTAGAKTVKNRGTAAATLEAEVQFDGTVTLYTTDVGAAGARVTMTYIAAPGVGSTAASVAAKLRETAVT